jgi:hypothetical protein
MTETLIYVNGSLIDLYNDTVFETTTSGLVMEDLRARNTKYTSSIRVPKTSNNDLTFGLLSVNDTTRRPYQKHSIKIVQNGLEVFNGTCFVKDKHSSYSLSGIGDELDIFQQLKDFVVSDLDDTEVGVLTDAKFYTYRNGSNGLYSPVINWGKLNTAPVFQLSNYDFATDTESWINEGDTDYADWKWHSANTVVSVWPGISDLLNTKVFKNSSRTFYAGYLYTLNFSINLLSSNTITFSVYSEDTLNGMVVIGGGSFSTSGTHTFSVTFRPRVNVDSISFGYVCASVNTNVRVSTITTEIDNISSIDLYYPFYFPSFSYKKVIADWILKATGLDYNLNLTTEQQSYIDSLLLSYVRESNEYSDNFIKKRTNKALADGSQVMVFGGSPTYQSIDLTIVIKNEYGSWSGGIFTNPNETYGYYADVEFEIVYSAVNSTTVRVNLERTNPSVIYYNESVGAGKNSIKVSNKSTEANQQLKGILMDNNTVFAELISFGANTITILSASLTITPRSYPQDETALYSNLFLPDISVYDLIKDYCIRTMSLVRVKNDVMEFMPVQNIINNKSNAVDWTNKRVSAEDPLTFALSGYAQENLFKDNQNGDFTGQTDISITNENLDLSKEYYTSYADAAPDGTVKGIQVASINALTLDSDYQYNVNEQKYDFTVDEKTALVKIRDSDSNDPVVKYGTTTAASFKVGQYAEWEDFKELFFTSFEHGIDKTKVIERYYMLNDVDIAQLDEFKLIFDTDSYYLLISCKSVSGQSSKCSILKVF